MTLGKKLYLWLACGVIKEEIKTFPDWPEKGVNFKDVQSILFKPELALLTSHYLQELLPKQESDFLFNKILCFDARGFLFGFDLLSVSLKYSLKYVA